MGTFSPFISFQLDKFINPPEVLMFCFKSKGVGITVIPTFFHLIAYLSNNMEYKTGNNNS